MGGDGGFAHRARVAGLKSLELGVEHSKLKRNASPQLPDTAKRWAERARPSSAGRAALHVIVWQGSSPEAATELAESRRWTMDQAPWTMDNP